MFDPFGLLSVGPLPIALVTIGALLYIRNTIRRINVPLATFASSLFISTFISSFLFFTFAAASSLFLLAAQCFGTLIYFCLLGYSFSTAEIGKRKILERTDVSRGRLALFPFVALIAVFVLDCLPFLVEPKCYGARCTIFRSTIGYDRDFQLYYVASLFGVMVLSTAILSVLHLLRTPK